MDVASGSDDRGDATIDGQPNADSDGDGIVNASDDCNKTLMSRATTAQGTCNDPL